MKSGLLCNMLLAAGLMVSCGSASPIGTDLVARDDVQNCISGSSCTAAANAWSDCSTKWKAGEIISLEPIESNRPADYLVQRCLCDGNSTIPSHYLWALDLYDCVYCIDAARGFLDSNETASFNLGLILGSPESYLGFCKDSPQYSYAEFIAKARALGERVNFPICLPDALPYSSSKAARGIDKRATLPVPSVGSTVAVSTTHPSATSTLKSVPTSMICNRDNCLRQFVRFSAEVAPFCTTYTKSSNQATTGLPTFVSQCSGSPSRVSSACSCLEVEPKASITSSALGQISSVTLSAHTGNIPTLTATQSATSSSQLRTVYSTHWVTVTLSTSTKLSTSARPSLSPITFLTSTSSKSSLASAKSALSSGNSKATSLLATSSNLTSTAKAVSSITTSPSAIPTWPTFPPSAAMKSCMSTNTCMNAHNIFGNCSALSTGLRTRNCLCENYKTIWIDNLVACTTCISKALPAGNLTAAFPAYIKNGTTALCGLTDPYTQSLMPYKFLEVGDLLTSYFQSPIYLLNVTWLAAPFTFDPKNYPQLDPKSTVTVRTGVSTFFITPTPSSHTTISTAVAASELSNDR